MIKEPASTNLRVPHKGDCSDADSGYDDPGVISIPVVRTVIRKDSDGRKSSTTSTEWVSFKKKDSTSHQPQSQGPWIGDVGMHSCMTDEDVTESRFCKETKNESDHNKRYHFIGRSRMARGHLMPTIRDVTISNSVHLQEETTKRTPRRRIRSKSADSRGSQNLFSPTYSKVLSPETMRKRRAWAEILKRDNILEEEYYKLPYEDINREIILGHRLSISETRLNILKGFERRSKADRDDSTPDTESLSSINDRLNPKKVETSQNFENSYENLNDSLKPEKYLISTNAATNDLKDLIADLISGSNLGVNFSLTVNRLETMEDGVKKQSLQSSREKPVPKPRNSLKNIKENVLPSSYCDDADLSTLNKELIDINKNYSPGMLRKEGISQVSPDMLKKRFVSVTVESPNNYSGFETAPLSDKRKLTKYELLNKKIDDYLEKSSLKPTFLQNENIEILPALSYSSKAERHSKDYQNSIFTNLHEDAFSDGIPSELASIKPRAKSSNSSDEGIVNISYSSHGSVGNSKDDLTYDDNSSKFSNLKRGRKKLKKKVSFSTESDEMFYPSTDSDSCAFDDGSPIDPDSGSESCLDDQELVVVRCFEVEGPFNVHKPVIHCLEGDEQTAVHGVIVDGPFQIYRPIIQYIEGVDQTITSNDILADEKNFKNTIKGQYRRAVDQTTIENNNNVATVVDKQLQSQRIRTRDEDNIVNRIPINFETKILPANGYYNSYLTNAESSSSLPEEKTSATSNNNKTHTGLFNDGNYKQTYRNKNNLDSSVPLNENLQNSRLSQQQLYDRDPYVESFQSKKTNNLSPFKGDYVNIHLSKGLDFTQHEIYLRTQMRTQKPVVTVTRLKVPFSSIRDQWDWVSPLMLQHRRTFEALARDFRNTRISENQRAYEQIVPIAYSPEGEINLPTSSCGSPTFSGSSSGCFSAPCSPSPSSPRNRAATLPTPL